MPTKTPGCKVCSHMEPETVDRLLVLGYGTGFVAQRWGLPRWRIKKHRAECLVGERRAGVEAWLRGHAGSGGVGPWGP
jgi:hypothetical protein